MCRVRIWPSQVLGRAKNGGALALEPATRHSGYLCVRRTFCDCKQVRQHEFFSQKVHWHTDLLSKWGTDWIGTMCLRWRQGKTNWVRREGREMGRWLSEKLGPRKTNWVEITNFGRKIALRSFNLLRIERWGRTGGWSVLKNRGLWKFVVREIGGLDKLEQEGIGSKKQIWHLLGSSHWPQVEIFRFFKSRNSDIISVVPISFSTIYFFDLQPPHVGEKHGLQRKFCWNWSTATVEGGRFWLVAAQFDLWPRKSRTQKRNWKKGRKTKI